MTIKTNTHVQGENGRPILLDYRHNSSSSNLPVIIFCHGFKGYKDWGAWNLMGSAFAKAGFLYISFNYSHNGGLPDDPIDFPDLEAFGNNNYSKEVRDTGRVLDWLERSDLPIDHSRITLLGHSRAGGIATIVSSRDKRIHKLITLASVADYGARFPIGKQLERWKRDGVYYIKNGRTHQEMPLYYQFYEDYLEHQNELDILSAARSLKLPHLIIHGTDDPTVSIDDAHALHKANPKSELHLLRGENHVFGANHPWNHAYLPSGLRQVVQCSINWMKGI